MDAAAGRSLSFDFQALQARALALAPDVFAQDETLTRAAVRFLAQIYEDAAQDDVADLSLDDLVFVCASFWSWAQQGGDEATRVRVISGRRADGSTLGRDILEVVTRDKPFIVDSILGDLAAAGIDAMALFHPIVALQSAGVGAAAVSSLVHVQMRPLNDAARASLLAEVRATMVEVSRAVDDFADMRLRMDHALRDLAAAPLDGASEERDEAIAFLRWLRDDHFAFLGCRDYAFTRDDSGGFLSQAPRRLVETGRGVLRDPERSVVRDGSEPALLTPEIKELLAEPSPLIVAKSALESRVHRRAPMDYVGVKQYRADGVVVGETRFVGLFTAEAYHDHVANIPLVRRKVARVLSRSGLPRGGHGYKRLKTVLETYPRDELFQCDEDELLTIALGVSRVHDRPRTRLFLRSDRYDRYISALAVIPRDRFNSDVRAQIGDAVARAHGGDVVSFTPSFDDSQLALVHYVIDVTPGDHPSPDRASLYAEVAQLVRTWSDDFDDAARRMNDPAMAGAPARYAEAFSPGYRAAFTPKTALADIAVIEAMGEAETAVRVTDYASRDDASADITLRLYRRGEAAALSDVLPILEDMGLHVLTEMGFPVTPRATEAGAPDAAIWVHQFVMRVPVLDSAEGADAEQPTPDRVKSALEAAVDATLAGRNERDGFNRLVVLLGLDWRDVCFLRACARFRQQAGGASQAVQEQALADHPSIVRMILALKEIRFDPRLGLDRDTREARQDALAPQIHAAIDKVASLDADHALRRLMRVVAATQRTNFHQRDEHGRPHTHIALKIASRELQDLPEPKPFREIFVWSPHVEGVHIRFGPTARGGLRWSDRRDDFRTEVLGLVKAQNVKNAVIVPVGAKGGFFPKHLPRGGDRAAIQAEGVRAYRTFITALLDVTDNLINETVTPPRDTVVWDADDAYLVVAADKGTAAFSDIANEIAVSRGFWLGDAFASGGSAGYDHKEMGITARGAWEAVKRHFREAGKDIQAEPFTVVGVGDMSGDVFGNGMLLSRKIRLLAAFDHRDIFLDPDPQDLEAAWEERRRLFEMGRSTWRDYDRGLMSAGGGVFSRSAKSIPLTAELQAWLGIEDDAPPPSVVISAILRLEAELLWFGGIGTYVKAAEERHDEVGDRANDALRIDAEEVRAAVIGEGANLGLTQAARIALARRGVRLNADFIDNAGGVDSSDNEVNIKIALSRPVKDGRLDTPARNRLLADMTMDVSRHVLDNVYDQTLAISIAQTTAPADLDAHERLIERLEARGVLDRTLEGLPTAEEFRTLKEAGQGLTRPEIAVLMSYAKNSLYERILTSATPDDPHFFKALSGYFPAALRDAYAEDIRRHALRREIIATILANQMVNVGGATFAHRAREATGADTEAVARGFAAAVVILDFGGLAQQIHALDGQVAGVTQLELYQALISILRRQTYWLVRRGRGFEQASPRPVSETIDAYQSGFARLRAMVNELMSQTARDQAQSRAEALVAAGAPEALAHEVTRLRALMSSSDVIDLARRHDAPLEPAAHIYHAVGGHFHFDQLRALLGGLRLDQHWDRLASRRLVEDLYLEQQRISESVLTDGGAPPTDDQDLAAWARLRLDAFVVRNAYEADRLEDGHQDLAGPGGSWTFSKLMIALANIREFAALAR